MAVKVKSVGTRPQKKKVKHHFHDETGHFKKGVCPNPSGRPKGSISGRAQAVLILDRILGLASNQKVMEQKLTARLLKDPVWFFRALVIPLVPKEQIMKLERAEKSPVRVTFEDDED